MREGISRHENVEAASYLSLPVDFLLCASADNVPVQRTIPPCTNDIRGSPPILLVLFITPGTSRYMWSVHARESPDGQLSVLTPRRDRGVQGPRTAPNAQFLILRVPYAVLLTVTSTDSLRILHARRLLPSISLRYRSRLAISISGLLHAVLAASRKREPCVASVESQSRRLICGWRSAMSSVEVN